MGTRQLARLQAGLEANSEREPALDDRSEDGDDEETDEPPAPKFNPFSLLSDDDSNVRALSSITAPHACVQDVVENFNLCQCMGVAQHEQHAAHDVHGFYQGVPCVPCPAKYTRSALTCGGCALCHGRVLSVLCLVLVT
jgi:hypothetical protein